MVCPRCHLETLGHNQFCPHCHATLFFRCPKCWHEQATRFICEKCGVDMDNYWRVEAASAKAVLVNEESTNMEESSKRAIAQINTVGMLLSNPIAALSWIVGQELFARIRRFMNI
jgi:hypothetical protein